MLKHKLYLTLTVTLLIVFTFFTGISYALAYSPGPKISFTFDDGNKNIYERAMPIFESYGLPAVLYGESGPINRGESWIMSWDQIRDLQNNRGWEIGSHSIEHPYLTKLSDSELDREIKQSKQDFENQGIRVSAFATPYGDYDERVLTQIARYYKSHRAAWGGPNKWPNKYNDYEIVSREVAHNIPPEEVYGWIDQAIENNEWLVLLLHDVVEGEPNQYEYNVNDLESIVRYAANNPIQTTTITEGLKFSDNPNLVLNYSFEQTDESGWATWWKRSNSSSVLIDNNNKGNYPEATNSVKIIGSDTQNTVSSGKINVSDYPEYVIRMYQNVQNLTSGGWALWVNEFDSSGSWIGGQWLGGNYANFIGNRYYTYTPSSEDVENIEIHLFTEAGSNLTLYADSIELRGIGNSKPKEPTTNLVKNPSFEKVENGWAVNWTRLDETISIDKQNNGSNPLPKNSLKIPGGSNRRAVISDTISVDGNQIYKLSFYQKQNNVTNGGTAVWVDEFDDNGTWISGSWLGGTYINFDGIRTMGYIPTSQDVSNIQIHFFTEAGSNFTAYIDEVVFEAEESKRIPGDIFPIKNKYSRESVIEYLKKKYNYTIK